MTKMRKHKKPAVLQLEGPSAPKVPIFAKGDSKDDSSVQETKVEEALPEYVEVDEALAADGDHLENAAVLAL
ncbi:hypothetical protein HDU97_007357 [Phlyctochytrium planicorne]|nr:hypothetical protein HDU97_007357 [Phlyctochytrium planicorne]